MTGNENINALIEMPRLAFMRKLCVRLVIIDGEDMYYKRVFRKYGLRYAALQTLAERTAPYLVLRGLLFLPDYGKLQQALVELENTISICNGPGYPEACREIIRHLLTG